jgi:hypothetical protein
MLVAEKGRDFYKSYVQSARQTRALRLSRICGEELQRRTLAGYWLCRLGRKGDRENGRAGRSAFTRVRRRSGSRCRERGSRGTLGDISDLCAQLEKRKEATVGAGGGIRHYVLAGTGLAHKRKNLQRVWG